MAIWDTRTSGDRTPFTLVVDFGESVNLGGVDIKYTLANLALTENLIDAQPASPTDITDEGAGQPPLSVWQLTYEPSGAEVTVEEPIDLVGYFTVTYAGGKPRHYPKGDYQRVSINPS